MDVKITDFSSAYRKQADSMPDSLPIAADLNRITTRALPTGQLHQILALDSIPSIVVSERLLDETRAALLERNRTKDDSPSANDKAVLNA